MQSHGEMIAMVQGPDAKTYVVHQGDKFADGAIKNITAQGLIVVQEVNDPLSLVKQREIRKLLRTLEDTEAVTSRKGVALKPLYVLFSLVLAGTLVAAAGPAGTEPGIVQLKAISARANGSGTSLVIEAYRSDSCTSPHGPILLRSMSTFATSVSARCPIGLPRTRRARSRRSRSRPPNRWASRFRASTSARSRPSVIWCGATATGFWWTSKSRRPLVPTQRLRHPSAVEMPWQHSNGRRSNPTRPLC
mgnify:CR=1 FL=1